MKVKIYTALFYNDIPSDHICGFCGDTFATLVEAKAYVDALLQEGAFDKKAADLKSYPATGKWGLKCSNDDGDSALVTITEKELEVQQ